MTLEDSTASDERFMAIALALGRRGLGRTWPNPAVGAVVARDGIIVGRGWTQPGGRPHAETEALRRAGAAANGATLYVTLEPCCHHGRTPPCTDAIVSAGIARVVSAVEDSNPQVAGQGHSLLRRAGIAVDVGIGQAEAQRGHAGHIRRMRDGRPHVTLKLAVSSDAKAGLAGRRPAAITSEEARARVHMMRAAHDAVLTGVGTVLADDPLLTCRLPGMEGRNPVRVILDTHLRTPSISKLADSAATAPVWIIAGKDALFAREEGLRARGIEILRAPCAGAPLDLAAALKLLAERGITRVMAEAGPILAASLVAADLVDAVTIFQSSAPLGAQAIDAIEGMPFEMLTSSPRFALLATERVGADTVFEFERAG